MNYKLLINYTKRLIQKECPTNADETYKLLIVSRMAAIATIEQKNIVDEKVRIWDRALKKLNHSDELNVKYFNPYRKAKKDIDDAIEYLSYVVMEILDIWQMLGGTFKQLCNLCNVSTPEMLSNMVIEPECRFSDFVFINYPDYKRRGDFVLITPNSPLTALSIERAKSKLLNNSVSRKAAEEAIREVFPELFDESDVGIDNR